MTDTTYKTATQIVVESLANELLFGHTDEATALVVTDYPYGFRQRTHIRYWLETDPKRGDRFVSQTLNPKTLRWNKPKKSTYSRLGVIFREAETGHIKWTGLTDYSDAEAIGAFAAAVGAELLNEHQTKQLAFLIGRERVMKHVKFTVEVNPQRTPEEQAAHDAEQKAIEQTITKAVYAHATVAHRKLTTTTEETP